MLIKDVYSEYQAIRLYSDCAHDYNTIAPPKQKALYQNCHDALGSDLLKTYHDKQRPFKTRQNPFSRKIFLFLILFILVVFFTINSFIDSNVFQTVYIKKIKYDLLHANQIFRD
ncbi:hypothetical protein K501DRAFT_307870 [Backusella circina FSU 941]|nr:hypothetical protein K501DRAFT_307870 [Backusella circina FSU 941]